VASNMFNSCTPDQIARFTAMWADPAISIEAIGEEFAICNSSVYRMAHALSLPANPDRGRVQRRCRYEYRLVRNQVHRERRGPVPPSYPALVADILPGNLHGLPARPRPGDHPGEKWVQLR